MTDVAVRNSGVERVGELELLWLSMYSHHATLAREVAPVRTAAQSWARRRAQYERWLADGEARLLIAERSERPVGYAVVTVGPGPATWDIGELTAELESLAVLSDERGAGTGALLIDAARRAGRELGAKRLGVGVAHANAGALRFYAREGFEPFYIQLLDATDLQS